MTLIEQLTAVITAIAEDISKNSGNSGSSNSDVSDISVLLPRKIGASQRWYQSGLRHGAEYPYSYIANSGSFTSGTQYFIPFTALEDATITALEIQCPSAKSNGTVSLGIYASDGNNDIANPLFTSNPINCSTTGVKNAPCNVQITKGKVYWLSALPIGATSFSCNTLDSLPLLKGSATATQTASIGYCTTNNARMAQSAPANKVDVSAVPRVMFVVA